VAAYRELRGHDDPVDALGPAPKPGQVEAYAAYRGAWRALGRPEVEREKLELSDGQLRIRVRAWDREKTWGPRYVGNELAGTRQAAATHRQTAALRAAEATSADDSDEQARLRTEAAQAAALAELLDARATALQTVDDARARWLAHTATTRVEAEQSQAELAARHLDDPEPDQHVTAEEWLTAHQAAQAEDERHRDIIETDVPDLHDVRPKLSNPDDRNLAGPARHLDRDGRDMGDDRRGPHDQDTAAADRRSPLDAPEPDLREAASREPVQRHEDVVRVPTADETADALAGAHRALAEIRTREFLDAREETEHRAAQLHRWHAADRAEHQQARDEGVELEPATYERAQTE
jgi:hypothetical protein